jgi:type IV secretory pathway VirB10-like protein
VPATTAADPATLAGEIARFLTDAGDHTHFHHYVKWANEHAPTVPGALIHRTFGTWDQAKTAALVIEPAHEAVDQPAPAPPPTPQAPAPTTAPQPALPPPTTTEERNQRILRMWERGESSKPSAPPRTSPPNAPTSSSSASTATSEPVRLDAYGQRPVDEQPEVPEKAAGRRWHRHVTAGS